MAEGEASPVEERIDGLYAGRPEDFVAGRDALAKELRTAGDVEGAARVKPLRRPTAVAWAVDQLAFGHAVELATLLELGERLRAAQEEMLGGGGAAALREAVAERRRLVSELADRAVAALGPGGEAHRDAISHTLEAAVADPGEAEVVRRGRLAKELPAPSGFGDVGGNFGGAATGPAAPTAASKEPLKAARSPGPDEDDVAARKEAEKAEAERARWSARLERLQSDAHTKAAHAREAAKVAAGAEAEVTRLRRLLATAEAALDVATSKAERARAAADRAEDEVRRARGGRPG